MKNTSRYTLLYAHRRLLALVVAVCVAVCAQAGTDKWDGSVASSFGGGSGTQAAPYLIATGAQLAYLADQVNSGTSYSNTYFKLANDIDCNGNPWSPIGRGTYSFRGTFDGDNHSIYDVKISSGTYMGLFGYTNGATIKNTFVDVVIASAPTVLSYAGGLIAYANSTTVENCHTMGDLSVRVTTPSQNMRVYVGGMIGYAVSCRVSYSHNYARVFSLDQIITTTDADNIGYTYAGGIAAYAQNSTFTYASNSGKIQSVAFTHALTKSTRANYLSYAYAGGIVGAGYTTLSSERNTFDQCYNKGDILTIARADNLIYPKYAWTYGGGISGWGGTANNCYNVGQVKSLPIWSYSTYNGYSVPACAAGMGWGVKATNCYNVGTLIVRCPTTRTDYDNGTNGTCTCCANTTEEDEVLGHDDDIYKGETYTKGWRTYSMAVTYPISGGFGVDGDNKSDVSSATNCWYLEGCCSPSNNNGDGRGAATLQNATMPNTLNSSVFIQDTKNINKYYPIFGPYKPYATTLDYISVDSTNAQLNGAYKYVNSADSVGYELRMDGEKAWNTYRLPLNGNPGSLLKTVSDLLRDKQYTYRIWLDEGGMRHYGDTLHFTTTCPAHNPVYRDTICYGSVYKEHDYDIKYGTTVTENDNGTAGFTGTYNAREGTFTYKRHLQTSWGCDSIMTLELTIAPTYEKEVSKTILDKQSPYIYPMPEGYRWETIPEEDRTFTTSGVKTLNLQTVSGCDSIVKLDLTITPTFDVFVNPNTAGWGEASVNKPYFTSGEMAEITATPAQYYHFVQWEKDGTIAATSATAKIPITASGTYTAIFAPDEFKVTTGVNNNSRGEIDPAGENSAPYATDYQITATPYTGYDFAGWSDGSPAGKERKYKVEPRDTTITALFEPHNYRVTTGVNDGSMGSVTEGGLKPYLSDFEITATPNAGYEFVGWSNGVSKGTNPYKYTVDARDTSITAQFAAKKILVTTEVEKIDGATPGDITQGGYIDYNYDTLIVATPRTGYRFKEWSDGAGSNPSRLYRVPATASTLTAVFEPVEVQISTTVVGNGSVNGANTYHYGDEVTLTPLAPTGYEFKQWQNGNTTSPLTFKINFVRDSTFTATFVPKQCNVRIEPDDINHGKVSQQSGSYAYGTLLEFTATAEEGYDFAGWSDGYQYAKRSYTVNNIDKDTAFVAKFTPKTYWVYTAVENGNTTLGTVSASQQCAFGASVTVTATPKTGYRFKQWDDGNTDNPRTYTLTIPSNVTLTALFEPKDVLLTTKGTNGTVTPNTGAHKFGDAIEVTATPNTGYKFAGWKGIDEKRSTFTFNIGANDTTLEALFVADNFELTVRVQDDNSDYGSVSPSGTNSYPYQSVVPISVTANDGFKFVRWQENNKTAANFDHTMLAEAQTYTALFDTLSYYIITRAAESAQGTVTPASGSHKYRTAFEVKAIPNEGYEFDHWNDDPTQTSAEFIYITPAKADELVAHFRPIKYHVTTTCDTRRGTVSPASDNYDFASQLSIKADALPGYKFLRWTNGSANNPLPYTVKAKSDTTFEALFEPLKYTVTLTRNNEAMGSVAGGGTYPFDTTVTITARPAVGYRFVRWSDGTTDADSVRSFHINVARDTTIQAIFTEKQYQVTTSVNYGDRGQVTAGGTKTFGTTFEITATPNAGYKFAGFTSDKWTSKVWNNPYDYTVAAYDLEIVAVFAPITYTITATVNDAAMGSVSPTSAQCDYKSSVNFTVTPKTGYSFVGWEDLSDTELTRNYTLETPNDVELKANFEANTYHITVQSANDEQGTATGSGDVVYNTEVVIAATPKDGYSFQKWQDGDTHATRTIDHYRGTKSDSVFTAYFTPKTYIVKAEMTSGKGSVNPTQQKGIYKQSVDITATPARGYQVQSWNGSASNEQNYTYSLDEPRDTVVRVAFAPLEIMVYANANDNQMGSASVTGGNKHAFDEEVEITASPKDGYKFVRWENESGTKLAGDASKTFIINSTSDTTFVAVFAPITYTITATVNDAAMGSVSPTSAQCDYKSSVNFTVTPKTGYSFVGWEDLSDTELTRNYTLETPNDVELKANFEANTYHITVQSANDEQGTATGSGDVVYNTEVVIAATPKDGYSFQKWQDGDTHATRTIDHYRGTKSDSVFTAYFTPKTYIVKAEMTSGKGSVNPTQQKGIYKQSVDITATPARGYQVQSWNGSASNEQNYTYSLDEPRDTVVRVAFAPMEIMVYANANDNQMGSASVTGGNKHAFDEQVTINASPKDGYKFVRWENEAGTKLAGDASKTFTINSTSDTTFVAVFAPVACTVNTGSDGNGTVTPPSGEQSYNTNVSVEAKPNEGYQFDRWRDQPSDLASTFNYRVTNWERDTTFYALFKPKQYFVAIASRNPDGGTVDSVSKRYDYNSSMLITAIPNTGYEFAGWEDGYSYAARYITVPANDNSAYWATFRKQQFELRLTSNDASWGQVTGSGRYEYQSDNTVEAKPNYGYTFVKWLDGKAETETSEASNARRTITLTSDTLLKAIFRPEQWSLTARIESTNENYQPDDMGVVRVVDGTTFDTITGANAHTYKAGHQARVAIEAVPYYGYKFVGWKRDNSEDPSRSVYLTSDTTFIAQFAPRTYTVAAQTNNLNMGSVTGGGKYDYLTQAHIVATPAEHHHLVRWEHGSKALNIDTLVKSNITLQAIFAIDTFHVDVRVSNTEKAEVVSGPGNYPYGAEVEIEAASTDANYHFIQWNDGNTDNPRTVQVTSNKTYTAEFALVYNINVKPYNTQLGSTSGTGSYGENHEIEIQAYPKEGYCFYQWLDGSNRTVSPDAGQQNPRTITVERDSVFVATFVPIPKLSPQPETYTICQGDTVRFENKLHQSNYWTRWTGDAIIGSNSDSVMYAAPDQSTTYKVEVGNEARDCTVSDSIRVIVIPKPTPQITATADSICQGDTVTLTATGDYTRYLWNTHSEATIIKVTPEKDSTFWLLAWNDFGCQADTVRYTIRVNAFGTRLEADKPTICMGDTATITCSVENAFNPALLNHTFRWRTSNHWLTPEGESSKTLQVSPREKTTYYCLVTDTTMGCTRWDSIAIDVNTRPKVLLRTSFDADAIFCAGDAAVFTVIPRDENSTDDLNFEWYRDREPIGENAPTLIDYPEAAADGLNDTTYTYSVVVKSKNGDCESISEGLQTTVTVGALPLLPIAMIVGNDTLATNDTVCANTPVRLYAKQIDRTLFTYRWYSQEEKKEITNYDDGIDEYVDIVPEHTATYTLTIENILTGCTRLVTRTIYTMPIPEITLMTSTKNGRTASLDSLNVCVGDSVTLTVLDSDGAQIDKRYRIAWYKDDSTEPLSTDSAYVLPTSEMSSHTYRVEVTNAKSAHVKYVCTQTKARKIRILAAPEPFALKAEMPNGEPLAETICLRAGQPLILRSDMPKVEGLRYVWSDNIGTLASDTTAYEATPMRTTTYTLEASNGACSYTAQYTVNVASEPWQIGGSTTLCPDETTRVYVVGARTAYGDKLQWSTGEETDTIEIAEAGDYYVYLTHTVREGRVLKQETTLIQFTIAEAVAPEITIATPKAVCPNDATIALNYTVTAGEPVRCSLVFDEAAKAAHFQDVNGRVLTPMQADDVLTGVIAIAIPDGATVGNYSVDVTVQNAAGCATTCTVPFVLSESTVALVLIDSTTVAVADSTAVAHYQWYKNGVSVGTDQFFFHETAQDSLNGIYKVVLTMRDGTELASCPVSLLTHTPPTTAPDHENPENPDPTSVCENTSLKMIYIDGDSLDGFSPAVYNYTVLLPYNTPSDKVPTAAHVSVDLANAYQTYVVAQSGSNAVQISVGSLCVPIDSGAIYTVQFVVDSARICRLTLNALPQSEFADSLIGGGEYRVGSVVELRAVAVNGYDFSHWSNDSSTANPQRITIVSDTTIAAYFKPAEHFHYTIAVAANNSDWGTVTGGGYFLGGSTITIEATANDTYEFAQWSDGVSDNPRSVLVERDWTYIAQFRPLGDAIEEIAVDNCVVYVVHDRIFVATDRETDLFVYNAIGQLIDHKARATEYTVRVPVAGLYLVNIGTKVVKVIVH